MSLPLRILLIAGALFTCCFVLRKMRRAQMLMADSVFWIVMSLLLVIVSIFPQIATAASRLLGVESPSNFVFLMVLFILIIKLFSLAMDVSQLKYKLKTLVEEYAVRAKSEQKDEKT